VGQYLGIMLSADRSLSVEHSYIRRRFYVSCNSILGQCKYASEEAKLQLIKSLCLPVLT